MVNLRISLTRVTGTSVGAKTHRPVKPDSDAPMMLGTGFDRMELVMHTSPAGQLKFVAFFIWFDENGADSEFS